jgi:hypothetical protein
VREPPFLEDPREPLLEDVEVDRLREEVLRAAAHRVDGRLDGSVRRDDDEVRERMPRLRPLQEIDAVLGADAQVRDDDVDAARLDRSLRVVEVRRDADRVSETADESRELSSLVRIVLDEDHDGLRRHAPSRHRHVHVTSRREGRLQTARRRRPRRPR